LAIGPPHLAGAGRTASPPQDTILPYLDVNTLGEKFSACRGNELRGIPAFSRPDFRQARGMLDAADETAMSHGL